ncbi:pyruvate kinase [Anaerosinus sp.]
MMKKTKIVCTMGPGTDGDGILEQLLNAGMNVGRCNFSHGDHEEQLCRITKLRAASQKVGKPVALLLDTKGPEMRLGKFKGGKTFLTKNSTFIITADEVEGTNERASVNHKLLPQEVQTGNMILLSDGLISLRVEAIKGNDIITTVMNSGAISSGKRVAVPGVSVNLPFLSEKDKADILFGIKNEMDFIAASFVQRAEDVLAIRNLLIENNYEMGIIAKIENAEGVKNMDEILKVSDGIMVARGDLGVEIPAEDVPLVQKTIIKKCNVAGKIAITATQMLESMVENPRPTRAETSDVANAIMDGTDAIMLSGETASGKYPVEAVKMMAKIAEKTEKSLKYNQLFLQKGLVEHSNLTNAMGHASVRLAQSLGAKAIVTASNSGSTGRLISKYRPSMPIILVTPSEKTLRKMQLYWGVHPILRESYNDSDTLINNVIDKAMKYGDFISGDVLVVASGLNDTIGSTNMLKVHVIK